MVVEYENSDKTIDNYGRIELLKGTDLRIGEDNFSTALSVSSDIIDVCEVVGKSTSASIPRVNNEYDIYYVCHLVHQI